MIIERKHETNLRANRLRKLEGTVQKLAEVVGHRDLLAIIAREAEIARTLLGQAPDGPCTACGRPSVLIARFVRVTHAHTAHEPLYADAFAIGEPATRSHDAGLLDVGIAIVVGAPKEIEAQGHEGQRLIHRACRDIDVDQHFVECRPDRLEVSTPQHNSSADVASLRSGEERSDVKRVVERRLHAHDYIECLSVELIGELYMETKCPNAL